MLDVSYSYEEEPYKNDLGIEDEPQEILDPNLASIKNQRPNPRWAQNLIDAARNGAGNLEDRRRTRSQYQNEHVSLSLSDSFPIEWCKKLPGKFYKMIENDQLFGPQKKKIDHSLPLPYIRNTHIHHFIRTLRGSHAQLQDVAAHKNYTSANCSRVLTSYFF